MTSGVPGRNDVGVSQMDILGRSMSWAIAMTLDESRREGKQYISSGRLWDGFGLARVIRRDKSNGERTESVYKC